MRDALSLLDMCLSYGGGSVDEALVGEVLGASDRTFLFAFAEHLLGGDAGGAMRDIDEMMRAGREPQVFARDVTRHLRALLLSQTCAEQLEDLLEITGEDAARYAEQGKRVSRERLLYMLDLFLRLRNGHEMGGPAPHCAGNGRRARLPARRSAAAGCPLRAAGPAGAAHGGGSASCPQAPPGKRPRPGPRPPGSPSGGTPPAPRAALAEGGALWEQVMRQVKKDIGLYAQVRMGTFAGIDGEQARLVFAKGTRFSSTCCARQGARKSSKRC